MDRIDAATAWSLGLWLSFGLVPTIGYSVGWSTLINHQGLAAWIQAFGSIFAILASLHIVNREHVLARQRVEEEQLALRRQTFSHWYGTVENAEFICRALETDIKGRAGLEQNDEWFRSQREELAVLLNIMRHLSITMNLSDAGICSVVELQGRMSRVIALLDELVGQGPGRPWQLDYVHGAVLNNRLTFKACLSTMKQFMPGGSYAI